MFDNERKKSPEELKAELEKVREIYEDGALKIGDIEYKFHKMTHGDRLRVFAYMQRLSEGKSYIGDSAWQNIEEHISKFVSIDDVLLCKKKDHFEAFNHADQYLTFMSYALKVVVYPFQRGKSIS